MNTIQLILERLRQLQGKSGPPVSAQGPPQGPPPSTMPQAQASSKDIFLPPESGQFDPRLPIAHLPEAQRNQMRDEMIQQALMRSLGR